MNIRLIGIPDVVTDSSRLHEEDGCHFRKPRSCVFFRPGIRFRLVFQFHLGRNIVCLDFNGISQGDNLLILKDCISGQNPKFMLQLTSPAAYRCDLFSINFPVAKGISRAGRTFAVPRLRKSRGQGISQPQSVDIKAADILNSYSVVYFSISALRIHLKVRIGLFDLYFRGLGGRFRFHMVHYIVAEIIIAAVLFINNLHIGIVSLEILIIPLAVPVVERHIHGIFGVLHILVVILIMLKPVCKIALMKGNRILPVVAVLFSLDHFTVGILCNPILHRPQTQFFFFAPVAAFLAVACHQNTEFSFISGNHGLIRFLRPCSVQVFCYAVCILTARYSKLVAAVLRRALHSPACELVAVADRNLLGDNEIYRTGCGSLLTLGRRQIADLILFTVICLVDHGVGDRPAGFGMALCLNRTGIRGVLIRPCTAVPNQLGAEAT